MAVNSSYSEEDHDVPHLNYDDLVRSYNTGTVVTFIVLILGLTANIALLWSLLTGDRRSRLRPFLINLALADLMVCCFTIAMELGWRLTVTWTAGDSACRFLSLTKTLGLYLEAFVVLVMSIDRCYVVLFPLRISGQGKRTKALLCTAWIAATVFSIPQAVVFHVEYHPEVPEFAQCVTLNSFPTPAAEKAYVVFGILAMYVIPLLIIISVSTVLLWTIRSSQNCRIRTSATNENITVEYVDNRGRPLSRQLSLTRFPEPTLSSSDAETTVFKPIRIRLHTGLQLYHTDTVIRRKARTRTLQLSMLVVTAFVLCYTPYAVMISVAFLTGRYLEDNGSGELMEGLLMLSLSFSTIMNPLVYGTYVLHTRKRLTKILQWFRKSPSDIIFLDRIKENAEHRTVKFTLSKGSTERSSINANVVL